MPSTASSPSGFLSSPRRQQWLLWISGAVLAAGIAVFLGVYLTRGTSRPAAAPANLSTVPSPPASTTPAPARVSPSPAAFKVARTFLQTAVLRKNLDTAYRIVGPDLKGGMSLAQWRKGKIAVTPYPARNAKTTQFVVRWSHKNQLMLQVVLNRRPGTQVRASLAFNLGLERSGGTNGKPARWLVNYWEPDYTIPVKANPYGH